MKTYYVPAEVAEMLRVKPSTLTRWRRENSGPPWLKVGGRYLYEAEALTNWIEGETA